VADETTAECEDLTEVEKRDRLRWNEERFLDLDFLPEIAELLANERVDWHAAEKLLKQGCSHADALRILL
jgi:hypothetical protein